MTLAAALHARLAADSALVGLLSVYRGGPAILTVDDVPEDVDPPFVVIPGADLDDPFDTKTATGRDVRRPIRAYTAATGSSLLVDEIAERIRALLHRQPVGLAAGAFVAECSGPVIAPTDSTFYGREVALRLVSLSD